MNEPFTYRAKIKFESVLFKSSLVEKLYLEYQMPIYYLGNKSGYSFAQIYLFFSVVIPFWNGLSMAAVNAESVTAFQANALLTIRQYCNAI